MGESQPGKRQRKLLQAEILENWIEAQKQQKRAPAPLKGRRPRVSGMQSSRQRRVMRQTADPVRAAYGVEHQMNTTPVRPDDRGLTREVGPNDKHNDKEYRTGKDTRDRVPKGQKKRSASKSPSPTPVATKPLSLEEFIANKGRI